MVPYWEKRIAGHRFFDWLTLVLGIAVVGLMLLRPRPFDALDYFGLAVFGALTVAAAYRLIRGRQPTPKTRN